MNQQLTRKKSRFLRELNTVIAVFAREITLFIKSPGAIIMSFILPFFMMFLIGGNILGIEGGEALGKAMLVGMLVNILFMVTSTDMASLVSDFETDFNQEMLIAPVSRYSLVAGKIIGSSFGAIISMVGTLLVGLIMGITLSFGQFLLILALSPLMSFAGGAFSMMIIALIKSRKTATLAVSLMAYPQMFLSGAIIPINESNKVLLVLSRMMPMTYCIDLAKGVIGIEKASFNIAINFAAIASLTLVFLVIGTFLFARNEKNR